MVGSGRRKAPAPALRKVGVFVMCSVNLLRGCETLLRGTAQPPTFRPEMGEYYVRNEA
jgi:hypothetical protein